MSPAPLAPTLAEHLTAEPPSYGIIQTNRYAGYERRASIQSTTPLLSPSLAAARAYYLQNTSPIGQRNDAQRRRRSLFEVQQIPRRHSTLARSEDLARHIATLEVTAPPSVVPSCEKKKGTPRVEIKIEEPEVVPIAGSCAGVAMKVGISAVGKQPVATQPVAQILHPVPFQYTHDRLRDWGSVYLGNIATADAFINAVSLRRPSLALAKEEEEKASNLVKILARVVPKSKERKPFLIQKDFDVEGLRAAMPKLQNVKGHSRVALRRSSRARRSSTQHFPSQSSRRGSTEAQLGPDTLPAEKKAEPIRKYFGKISLLGDT